MPSFFCLWEKHKKICWKKLARRLKHSFFLFLDFHIRLLHCLWFVRRNFFHNQDKNIWFYWNQIRKLLICNTFRWDWVEIHEFHVYSIVSNKKIKRKFVTKKAQWRMDFLVKITQNSMIAKQYKEDACIKNHAKTNR